ncbi:MAG: carboxypeptidase regulatory-like domain-containing protein [Salinibacter sp.]|uniref:carboxypeptidase regulatory-like domain-containing protein n=1 Tax=Salinibacter sp. TaxID=2065818 RepID=UPI002FC3C90A
MRVRAFVLVLVVAYGAGSSAVIGQPTGVIEGRVLDAETNAPLPRTHVFVAESVHGTITDSTGRFRLEGIRPGPKRLYVSRVGHERRSLALRPSPSHPLAVTVRLRGKVLESPPVTVSAERDEEWYERLDHFKRLFIGDSDQAEQCTLVNPEVLRFDDKWWGRFEAWAEKPVIIENRALGYRVTYFLKEFEEQGSVVRWDGEPLFDPLTPADSAEAARWRRNRLEAYRGSLRHFLRALMDDRLDEEQFDLYRLPRASAVRRATRADRRPTRRSRILEPGPDSTYLLNARDRLEVVYRGRPEREAYLDWAHLRRRPRNHQTSQIELNERPVHIAPSGEIVEPYGATLYQYFAFTTRMAKRLPRKYQPPT